jgi:hypothetical protein
VNLNGEWNGGWSQYKNEKGRELPVRILRYAENDGRLLGGLGKRWFDKLTTSGGKGFFHLGVSGDVDEPDIRNRDAEARPNKNLEGGMADKFAEVFFKIGGGAPFP